MSKRWLWIILLVILGSVGVLAQEEGGMVQVIKDIDYIEREFSLDRNQLDLYLPVDVDDYPVMIFAHGGAWVSGSKEAVAQVGLAFAKAGIGVVLVNYRLSPGHTHPDHVNDIAHAYAWVVDNIADYGGDPSRIVLAGHSVQV